MAIFGGDKDFTDKISENFGKFGIKTESADKGEIKNTLRFNMFDTINDCQYVAVAIKSPTGKKSPEIWDNVMEKIIIPAVLTAEDKPAAALIIPTSDADYVLEQLSNKYLSPTVYQLFPGYIVAGFQKKELAAMAEKFQKTNNPTPIINDKKETTGDTKNSDKVILPKQEETTSTNPTKNTLTETEKAPSSLKKKLIAAALLGTSLALAPIAVNTVMENITSDTPLNNAATVNNPTANYFDAIKNGITADPEILKYIASNPQIAQEELERLSETPVGTEVLKNPSAPINILEKAALSNDEEKRAAVAENPSTPLKHLRRLSKDKSDKVRSSLAKNQTIPRDIMKDLAQDSPKVRESLLENHMLTPDILDILTSNASASCDFNKKLMANPCIAPSVLAYNANNPDVCIRAGVAANPNTPKDIISKLADDSFPEVKSAAWKNPNIHQDKLSSLFLPDWTPQSIEHPTEQLRQYALENPSLDQDILDKAIFAAPERYADNVAKNPSASADTLNKIKNISKGKGGLKQFISDAMQLTTDAKKINNIKDEAAKYDNNPEIPLRKALNENFLKNVYNPYNLINDMRMLSKNHNQNTDLENKSHSNVTPASNIDMSIDKPISTTYSLELPEEIPESFSDILETIDDNENNTLSEAEKEAFATADRIVESLMEDILPHYSDNSVSEENIGDRDNRFDTMEGNTNQLNNLLPTGDNDNNLQPTMGGSQPIGHNIPILGNPHQEWLFKNACEHIDELQSMF